MVKLIIGGTGSGKTKELIDQVNAAVKEEKGSVVCISRGNKLTFDISHDARLIDAADYPVSDIASLLGFVGGLHAGNYDITDMFIDNVLRIGKTGLDDFAVFVDRLNAIKSIAGVNIVISVSADQSELPESVRAYL